MRTAALVVCVCVGSARGAPSEPVEQLVARELGNTPMLADLQELTDTIGGRPTGSAAFDRAADWALDKLRTAGLENVHAESYTAPRNWLPRTETAEIVAPQPLALRVAAMPMSPATPGAGLEADVVDVGAGAPAQVVAAGARVKGAWVLVHTEPMRSIEDLFKEYNMTPPLFAAAQKAGAAGVLWISNRHGRLLYRHSITLDGSIAALPGALIEREGGERIARMVAGGQRVRVRVSLAIDVQDKPTDRNVVAELRGRDKADEVVVIGAHLDSWDLGRGALDDGCNAAMVIDVARQMMALAKEGIRPRRTVRFVLYSGEELGLYGSWLDARNHRADLDKLVAMVTYDEGTGRTTGFSLGRGDLKAGVDRALAPVAGLGPFVQTEDAFIGTDNYDYLLEGVPTLVANQDGAPYLADYHAESDTFDKVDTRELRINGAIAAALVWGLADAASRLGPRQSRAEIDALVKKTGLVDQMKTFNLWSDYVAGRRGRAR